jgi:alkaline phosphatase
MRLNVHQVLAILCIPLSWGIVRAESPEQWLRDGRAAVRKAKELQPITGMAKNVILFIGDGMGVSTVTAARILEGQRKGRTGEENLLSFETFPYTALIKTYETNQQTGDSAGTMTAMVTGVKTKAAFLSVSQNAVRGDHVSGLRNKLPTILELAERAGLSTGVVTTARVTHATPAACYAHSPERDWEDDGKLTPAAKAADFPDIARQLIEFDIGDGLEVALGGGRSNFLPKTTPDPEDTDKTGRRTDGRDLTAEWLRMPNAAYVWNKAQFDAVDVARTDHLLGLFEGSHMEFEHDRPSDKGGEPSLSEMTGKAIDLLARNTKGYFLMVEGARIDHAHHRNNAFRALGETIEFASAVRTAVAKTDRRETLIIVTADHGHVFTIAGYAPRGNAILGKVTTSNYRGEPTSRYKLDTNGLPFTTLGYANGPGYISDSKRPDLTNVDTEDPGYRQETAVPLRNETHGGEDVPLYADGPQAHLFHGVLEQNVIFHVMAEGLGLNN